jgi:hypothetical protein
MVTLDTLLPSDNDRLVGLFKGFLALLLIPSDNKFILLGKEYKAHIEIYPSIKKSINCMKTQYA